MFCVYESYLDGFMVYMYIIIQYVDTPILHV